MTRQKLGDGRWFDVSAAKKFEEDTYWNGQNHVSKATLAQWDHETLFRTKGGRWILHWWSQWEGSRERWDEIDNEAAARWLVANNYDEHPACAVEFAALEVK